MAEPIREDFETTPADDEPAPIRVPIREAAAAVAAAAEAANDEVVLLLLLAVGAVKRLSVAVDAAEVEDDDADGMEDEPFSPSFEKLPRRLPGRLDGRLLF